MDGKMSIIISETLECPNLMRDESQYSADTILTTCEALKLLNIMDKKFLPSLESSIFSCRVLIKFYFRQVGCKSRWLGNQVM